jgi:D-xylose transport system substrate-binding protein
MRRLVYLFIVVVAIGGCINRHERIGFILPNLNNKRYIIEKDHITDKCKEKGIELLFASSDNDELKQIEQFNEMLNKKVKVIILDPVNRFTAAVMVRKAHEEGVKVISYDRLIVGCEPDAYISFDARKIGEQLAGYALQRKPKGLYVILNGDRSDINAVWIQEGMMKQLQPAVSSKAISIGFSMFVEYWNEAEARHLLNKYLKLSADTPDVILCSSDMMARGCITALNDANIDIHRVLITGQNAEPYACKAILEGKQAMTLYKPVRQLADLAVELSIRFIHSQAIDDLLPLRIHNGMAEIPSQLLDGVVIDSSSINVLIKDNYLQASELK